MGNKGPKFCQQYMQLKTELEGDLQLVCLYLYSLCKEHGEAGQ